MKLSLSKSSAPFLIGAVGLALVLSSTSAAMATTTIGSGITTDGTLQLTTGAANHYILTSDASGNAAWATSATTDSLFAIKDGTDASKTLAFDVQGSPSTTTTLVTNPSTNQTITFPDATGTVLLSDGTTGIVAINQNGALHGSNAGIQFSSLTANRAGIRFNQYGANTGIPGVTGFKSRGLTIGSLAAVAPGDVLFRDTAIGVAGDNASIPLAGTISINVAPSGVASNYVATDFQVSLVPLAGPINGRKEAFKVSSEGILSVKEQANSMAGVATLDAAGQAIISNTQVAANSRISLTIQDGGTVPTGFTYVASRSAGTSFTIQSSAGAADSGVKVYYQLWAPTTP